MMDGENRERIQIEGEVLLGEKEFKASRDHYLRAVEDSVEQNDNSFDGIINNTPVIPNNESPSTDADEKKKEQAVSVLEELKKKQPEDPQLAAVPTIEEKRKQQSWECERVI